MQIRKLFAVIKFPLIKYLSKINPEKRFLFDIHVIY